MDVFSHFRCLDELIQLIYQGHSRFVLLSTVTDSSWAVHLRLSGPQGRCWRGNWLSSDVLKIAGSKASPEVLETLAERLADVIVKGELSVGNWDTGDGTAINLTLGPFDKKPLTVPLVELTLEEASSHATGVFISLALEARDRKCQLNPTFSGVPAAYDTNSRTRARALEPAKASSSRPSSVPQLADAQDEIRSLRVQLETSKTSAKREKSPAPEAKVNPAKAVRKGASLANPNKKARKYQALEFASDEE